MIPNESVGRKLDLVSLVHPGSQKAAKFLFDQGDDAPHRLFELTRVGNDARSALIDDSIIPDGSLVVATPLHPLFTCLNVVFAHRNKPLPLETILELSANEETQSLPEEVIEPYLTSVCLSRPGPPTPDLTKLKAFLDTRVARIRAGLPQSVRADVLQAVQPINPNEQPSPELIDLAELYGSVSMLVTSWTSPELGEWYLSTHDFSMLENTASGLHEQHLALQSAQFAVNSSSAKRASSDPKPAAKKAKPAPKNNSSILDMFKKK